MKTLIRLLALMILATVPVVAQNGQLVRAEYGVVGQMADVTSLVSSRIQNGSLNFVVSNDDLGGDPVRGQRKILRIWLRRSWWDSKSYDFPEGSTVNLQISGSPNGSNPGNDPVPGAGGGGGGSQFVRAEYGLPGRFVDVTSRVQQQAQNGVFACQIGSECLGIDPVPGVRKIFRVTTRGFLGNARFSDFNEGDTVSIPVSSGNSNGAWGGSSWAILHAEYGRDGQSRDVTDRVRSLVQNNSLNFRVTNDAMGGDPARSRTKQLFVAVRQGSSGEQDYTFREGETIHLQLGYGGGGAGHSWSVARAQYGVPGRFLDVTQIVSGFLVNNSLNFRVSNQTFGRDPADDHKKTVIVRLRDSQNRELVVQYDEGDDVALQLP